MTTMAEAGVQSLAARIDAVQATLRAIRRNLANVGTAIRDQERRADRADWESKNAAARGNVVEAARLRQESDTIRSYTAALRGAMRTN